MKRFSVPSLRIQLALLGLAAVLVPLVLLLTVVFATSSSEEVMLDESGAELPSTITQTQSGVPAAVLVTALIVAVAGCIAVWSWSGRAVRPMRSITAVTNEIQAGSLDRRLRLRGAAAEVQALGDSFDAMLERLERASATQQRLVEDTSHELRTPLTALAVNTEVILNSPNATDEDFRSSALRSEVLIGRLQLTIDHLLLGARTRHQAARQVDNDLMAIVARVVEQHRALDPDITLVVDGPERLTLGIDGPSVQRALSNLVENAARFSPAEVPIEITVTTGDVVQLSVTDGGPGIESADLDRIFDRYYRTTDDDHVDGVGIGLALVKQVADAHGHIAVQSPPPDHDRGTRFTISFRTETSADRGLGEGAETH